MRLISCLILLSLLSAVGLTGCTLSTTALPAENSGGAIQGSVFGGQQPVVGAIVNLYAAGTGGYGSASTLISTSSATTDSNGNFIITGDYSCTTGQQVYLLATGGNAGAGTNSAISLMTILGNCPGPGGTSAFLSSLPAISVNEVTTVAAAYVLAPYASDVFTVGTSGTSLAKVGIANGFATAANLVSVVTGAAYATTPAGNGTVPQSEINTLANIIAACVNTSGPTHTFPGGNACDTLLNTATSNGIPSNVSGGAAASSDTATAAIYIAQHPGSNISTLYALQAGVASPFAPYLSSAPNDFTVALNFIGGGLNAPSGLAIDASGNVWDVNYTGNSLTELSPSGSVLSGTGYGGGGLYTPDAIAIDGSSNVWVTNRSTNSLSKFTSSGTPITGSSGYTDSNMNVPLGLAIDSSGNVWVANGSGLCITDFNPSGTAIATSTGCTGGIGSIPQVSNIAIDSSANIWVPSGKYLSKFQVSGTTVTGTAYPNGANGNTGSGASTLGIAIDPSSNVWASTYTQFTLNQINSISELSSSGTLIYVSLAVGGGGQHYSEYLAFDGSGNLWMSNNYNSQLVGEPGNSVSEFNSSGTAITGSTGYTGGGLSSSTGIAIDGSGNVWVANSGNSSITELVGATTPVVTPIVANLISPYTHPASKP